MPLHNICLIIFCFCAFCTNGVIGVQKARSPVDPTEVDTVTEFATIVANQTDCVKYWYIYISDRSSSTALQDFYREINENYLVGIFQFQLFRSDSFLASNRNAEFLNDDKRLQFDRFSVKYHSHCRAHFFLDFTTKLVATDKNLTFKKIATQNQNQRLKSDRFGPEDYFIFYNYCLPNRIQRFIRFLQPLRISKGAIIKQYAFHRHQNRNTNGNAGSNDSQNSKNNMWVLESFCPECEPQKGGLLYSYSPSTKQFLLKNPCGFFEAAQRRYDNTTQSGQSMLVPKHAGASSLHLKDTYHFLGLSSTEETTCSKIILGEASNSLIMEHHKILISFAARRLNFDCVVHPDNMRNRKMFINAMESRFLVLILTNTETIETVRSISSANTFSRVGKKITFPLASDHLTFGIYVQDTTIEWKYYIFEVLSQPFDKYMFLTTVGCILGIGVFVRIVSLLRAWVMNENQRIGLFDGFMLAYSFIWHYQSPPARQTRIFNRISQAALLFPGLIISTAYMGNMMAILVTTNAPSNNPTTFQELFENEEYELVVPYENIGPMNFKNKFQGRLRIVPDLHECLTMSFWKNTVCVNTRRNLEAAVLNLSQTTSYGSEFRKIYISPEQTYQVQETWKIPSFLGHLDTFQTSILHLQAGGIIQQLCTAPTSLLRQQLNPNKKRGGMNVISYELFLPIVTKAYLLGILIAIFVFLVEMCKFANHQRKEKKKLRESLLY